jgi:hypothetical protein
VATPVMLGALADMAIHVVTKDCTALSDSDLAEMADLAETVGNGFEIGVLSKQAEAWVLVTLASVGDTLAGFSFCTLERIGGTPSVLVGLACVARGDHSCDVLEAVIRDQLRRAVLAFPDEDVLIGTRMVHPNAFEAYRDLNDIVPRPGHKASGEERAWGRRLAKRFGIESGLYEDRMFVARGDGSQGCMFDYRSSGEIDADVAALFDGLNTAEGDVLIAFGWAMAEYLDSLLNAAA